MFAVIGLGALGSAVARRLLSTGHEVIVWNRTPQDLAVAGLTAAQVARSPADAAAAADVVLTVVSDAPALRSVLLGPSGAFQGARPGALFADLSTVGPDAVADIRRSLPSGVAFVDSPVRGGPSQADTGGLTLLVGGHADDLARAEETLAPLGTVLAVGPPGSGAALKVAVNVGLGVAMTALAEVLVTARRLDVSLPVLFDVLDLTPMARVAQLARTRVESGDTTPSFKLSLAAKDLRLALEAADLPLPVTAAALATMAAFEGRGCGGEDFTVMAVDAVRAER